MGRSTHARRGIELYFEVQDCYAEFRLGDHQHELGLIDRRFAPDGSTTAPGGAVIYWHADELTAAFEKRLSMGASEYQPHRDRGEGFVTAAVVDPFGNVLGIMDNPHYLEVLGSTTGTRPRPPVGRPRLG